MKLLEIPQAIDDAIENFVDPETGEILSEEETLAICEKLEGERLEVIEWLCKKAINEDAELEALQEHKRKIDARIKAKENSIKRLKKFIGISLEGEKFKSSDALVSVMYRTTKNTVKIDSIESIDDKWFKKPHTENNLAKTAIKEAILNGEQVAGAHLEDSTSVIIKG